MGWLGWLGGWGGTSRVALVFNAMHAALFGSLLLAALVAVFGCINIGLAYGLEQICTEVVGAVDGLCFELNVFGIDGLRCGFDFQEFCDAFASNDSVFTFWGSFIAVAGHYYLIASAGAAQQQFMEVQVIFSLLPNRTQYMKGIADLSQSIKTGELERLREEKESVRASVYSSSVCGW
jgi:hypothetical protein